MRRVIALVETSCHVCCLITQETIDFVSEKNIYVRVLAGINVVTREARWEFQSLDPQTGQFLSRHLLMWRYSLWQTSSWGSAEVGRQENNRLFTFLG